MKKTVGIFIIVLISLGIADLLKGMILTSVFTANYFSTNGVEMAKSLSYIISAATVTIALWIVFKLRKGFKSKVAGS